MIVIFDVEGVLVDGEFFPELAKLLDMEEEITEITLKGIRGEIDWRDGLMQRLERVKGVPYESCLKVCDNLPYMEGAEEVCSRLRSRGWTLVAVSGGPTLLSGRVARELHIDHVFGNDLIFKEGRLETMDVYVDSDKSAAVGSLVRELGEKKKDTVAVIDGANDLKLIDIAGTSIAFNATPLVEECTDYIVKDKDLSLLLPILERRSEARIEAARRLDA